MNFTVVYNKVIFEEEKLNKLFIFKLVKQVNCEC